MAQRTNRQIIVLTDGRLPVLKSVIILIGSVWRCVPQAPVRMCYDRNHQPINQNPIDQQRTSRQEANGNTAIIVPGGTKPVRLSGDTTTVTIVMNNPRLDLV